MRVNVFITRQQGQSRNELLVLPASAQSAIPPQYQAGSTYYATTDTADRMFGDIDTSELEADVADQGFAIVKPATPDRQ
jgi:hypothetical protein